MTKTCKSLKGSSEAPERGYDTRIDKQIERYNQTEGSKDGAKIYDCPICKNKGNIAYKENGAFYTKPCECLKIRQTIRMLNKSGLGAVDKNTLDNYNAAEQWQKNILSKARRFAAAPLGEWFYIGGQVGAGKTHIGKAVAYEFIKRGINVRYMEWKRDVQALNAIINDPEYLEAFNRFVMPQILYIDDFLKTSSGAKPTQGEINRAIDIIYQRYNQTDTAVIISSELTTFELCRIDEGMGSRISERCENYTINIGKDAKKNYRTNSLTKTSASL